MGRKSLSKNRKQITSKAISWLSELLIGLQYENLAQLTMDDIAKIAGKSKSTIYQYFESKEEILQAACQTRTKVLAESILKISGQKLDTVKRYGQLIEIFAAGTADISLAFLQNIKQYYPAAWSVIDEFTDTFVALLKDHYQEGIAEGTYNSVSIELLGNIDKLFIIQVVTNPSIFSDEKYTVSELVRDYLNLRLMGLLKR
jgi:AcrR family transcriptional regulator